MKFFDVCFNATHQSFKQDLNFVLERARKNHVTRMIIPGCSLPDSNDAIALSQSHSDTFRVCAGVHPHLARKWRDGDEATLQTLAQHPAVVAIGETGLDYNRNYSTAKEQNNAFEHHIKIAMKTGLPLFLHQRDAHDDLLEQIRKHRDQLSNVLVHCFTGTQQMLRDYLKLDLYVGVTGWICDPVRGKHLHPIVAQIPRDRLVIETDAPYLLPRDLQSKPSRKHRNEPAFLPHVAATIARCMQIDLEELAALSWTNAEQFFGWQTP